MTIDNPDAELLKRHEAAEANPLTFKYTPPNGVSSGKGRIDLGKKDIIRGVVQIVKKNGGENNLHYHPHSASFWMVLKGRVRFYGPGDVVIGEFGPNEGTVTPRFSRYWFENCGDEDLEILQVMAYTDGQDKSGRTDVEPQKFDISRTKRFSGVTSETEKA